jgi:class 3 adenylate cyclase
MPPTRQQFRDLFEKDRTFLRDAAAGKVAKGDLRYVLAESMAKAVQATAAGTAIVPFGSLQQAIRPAFAKPGVKPATFGDHPDYQHLRSTTSAEYGEITTLFMDVQNSTRLGILYPLERVYLIKNAFICSAIEIVNAFDGHVHRIMGDAVMAFFGGKERRPEDGAIDALNCAAVLRYYVDAVVVPALSDGAPDESLGVRIGLDYGPAPKVLWSAYGYPGNEEVTATSFHVDVASKLQHAAGRNQIMIGQALREFLDFPEELLRDKTVIIDGKPQPVPYVTPNHTLSDGKPVNYRQHLLEWEDYLATTGVAPFDPQRFARGATSPEACDVVITVHATKDGPVEHAYAPSAFMVDKWKHLRFVVRKRDPWLAGATVSFAVENHGREASLAPSGNSDNHVTTEQLGSGENAAVRWESTAYRGLHYMTVTVDGRAGLAVRQRIGIYVA